MVAPLGAIRAQSVSRQLWSEIDAYWTPSPSYRFLGTSSLTRDQEVDTPEATLALYVDVATRWGFARFGTNITRALSSDSYREDRFVAELTTPITTGQWRFRSRTRFEQRWISGGPSQRYRERFRLERETMLPRRISLLPYAAYEVYYDTRYRALSRTGYRLGTELPLVEHLRLDLSGVRQDNRFGYPRHVSAAASVLSFRY